MKEYYFLFLIALIWIIFASVQDLRKREVANWLNFSLLAFGLAYRFFYSYFDKNITFLLYGFAGLVIFTILAHLFYYGKVFAGGDAKLLMALGVIYPYNNWIDLVFVPFVFIFALFLTGFLYSLIYSAYLSYIHFKIFEKEFRKNLIFEKWIIMGTILISILFLFFEFKIAIISGMFVFIIGNLYIYLKAVDKCMIKLRDASELTEGDWITGNINVNGKIIRKTVHGLTEKDILLLRKYGKKVYVKEGIPFIPVFLISHLVMLFFFLFLQDQLYPLFLF